MAARDDLAKNFDECIEGGLSEESKKRYRNAIELYYKEIAQGLKPRTLVRNFLFKLNNSSADLRRGLKFQKLANQRGA